MKGKRRKRRTINSGVIKGNSLGPAFIRLILISDLLFPSPLHTGPAFVSSLLHEQLLVSSLQLGASWLSEPPLASYLILMSKCSLASKRYGYGMEKSSCTNFQDREVVGSIDEDQTMIGCDKDLGVKTIYFIPRKK